MTGLRKRYPSFELRDVSLEVPAGRIVGFVGRNGAKKTTTLRCVTGAARADGGRVAAFGRDAAEDWAAMRRLTGIVLGGALYYETKTLAAIAGVTSRIFDSWDVRAFDALAEYLRGQAPVIIAARHRLRRESAPGAAPCSTVPS